MSNWGDTLAAALKKSTVKLALSYDMYIIQYVRWKTIEMFFNQSFVSILHKKYQEVVLKTETYYSAPFLVFFLGASKHHHRAKRSNQPSAPIPIPQPALQRMVIYKWEPYLNPCKYLFIESVSSTAAVSSCLPFVPTGRSNRSPSPNTYRRHT